MDFLVETVYEDPDFAIISKPAGLLAHGIPHHAKKTDGAVNKETLADWILKHYPETRRIGDDPRLRPGMVHRLDKDTSGAMVIARSKKAFEYLKNLFKEHKIKKTYLALVLGRLRESGIINLPIGIKSGTTRRVVFGNKMKFVKPAETRYRPIKFFCFKNEDLTLAELEPLTGRTHQIRVHLNAIHHPVIGDRIYGGRRPMELARVLGLSRQFLHAAGIEFLSPSRTAIRASVDLPPDLEQALNQLQPEPADQP
ncbi:MAG TPA: RluA family pseudouridine synthase [Candidatus Paceibacterota bacterium]